MSNWNFEENNEPGFQPMPVGKYRVRIEKVELTKSKKDNDMYVIELAVSGSRRKLFHNITLMNDKPELTNKFLTQFFKSFNINRPDGKVGDMNHLNWIGKIGGVMTKHEEYDGIIRDKVNFFIEPQMMNGVAPWEEPPAQEKQAGQATPSAPTTPWQVPTGSGAGGDVPPI